MIGDNFSPCLSPLPHKKKARRFIIDYNTRLNIVIHVSDNTQYFAFYIIFQ